MRISKKYLDQKKDEEKKVARTYYLDSKHIKVIDDISAEMNWDKVEVIRHALNLFIKDFYDEGKK